MDMGRLELTRTTVFVKDSPLWSINIMNGTNMWFDDIYVNNTATSAPYGKNWVQNTDGFDTMDAYNIGLTNFVYQGGDDAIAIKPRSYNIYCQNVSTRIAFFVCVQTDKILVVDYPRRKRHCDRQSGSVQGGLIRRKRHRQRREGLDL